MIVGAGEARGAQDRVDGFGNAPIQNGLSAAGTGTESILLVGEIPVQSLRKDPGRNLQGGLATALLQGLEIERAVGALSQEVGEFLLKTVNEEIFEFFFPPFAGSLRRHSPGPASS